MMLGQSFIARLDDWKYEIPYPSILDNGEWDATLRIVLARKEYDMGEGEFVAITYSPNKILTITGETTSFSGVIPEDIGSSNAFFEDVLVDAFKNPYIPGEYHPLNLPGFKPPHPDELIV